MGRRVAPCDAAGCDRNAVSRGLCMRHYSRERRLGFPTAKLLEPDRTCTAEDCTSPAHARLLCMKHYHLDYRRLHPHKATECSVAGCERSAQARGMCHQHWRHQRSLGFPDAPRTRQEQIGSCSVPDCPDPARTGGMCGMHYQRHRRNGDPLTVQRIRTRPTKETAS